MSPWPQRQVTPETPVNSEENNEIILNILMCPRKHVFVPWDFDKNAKMFSDVVLHLPGPILSELSNVLYQKWNIVQLVHTPSNENLCREERDAENGEKEEGNKSVEGDLYLF